MNSKQRLHKAYKKIALFPFEQQVRLEEGNYRNAQQGIKIWTEAEKTARSAKDKNIEWIKRCRKVRKQFESDVKYHLEKLEKAKQALAEEVAKWEEQ